MCSEFIPKKVFADMVKDLEIRSSWIRMDPQFKDKCPRKRKGGKKTKRIMCVKTWE